MENKIKWMLVIVLALCCGTIQAQNNRQRHSREQLAEMQATHIANEMAMDDATSKRFVEVYCNFQREIWALGPRPKQRDSMTEDETEQVLKERFAHSQKILEIREKYYAIYSEFLTQKQIQRVYELERQMMKRLSTHGKKRNARSR